MSSIEWDIIYQALINFKPYFTEKTDLHDAGMADEAIYEGILGQTFELVKSGKFRGSEEGY